MRRKRQHGIVVQPMKSREELEALYGRVWIVQEVAREFIITSIIDESVVVRRKVDGVVGILDFEGPFYFNFRPYAAGIE